MLLGRVALLQVVRQPMRGSLLLAEGVEAGVRSVGRGTVWGGIESLERV